MKNCRLPIVMMLFAAASTLFANTPARAQEAVVRTVILNAQSRFEPDVINVPRNMKFLLIIRNESKSGDEIESDDLGDRKSVV